jgi:hypothetical protein
MADIEIVCVHVKRAYHKPNLVVFRNVFDPDSEEVYFGNDAVERFVLKMISYNFGLNVAIAHNGAGYDSRLLFETLTKLNLLSKLEPTTRGTKFLQLTVNKNTQFRDSLLHLPGSLSNLAKDFGLSMRKGNFPHLFNTAENYDYEGPIPGKEYFDLSFSAKSSQDIIEFNEWHSTQTGIWNFKNELIKYCQDDVKILASLAMQFHDICVDRFSISPWFSATAPSYVHKVVIKSISSDEYLQLPDEDEIERRRHRLDELAEKEHWAALLPAEYWFARKALRGGRTDARCLLKELSQEEIDRGCEIRYQDIVSMYPYVQVAYDYPVGVPKIHIYDTNHFPCRAHENPESGNSTQKCQCPLESRQASVDKMLNIEIEQQPLTSFLETFFGIICVSMKTPLNLFHPVLVVYDEEAFKCTAPLGDIVEGVFTSVEFQKALQKGYKVSKVHRIDEYNKRPGLWNDFVKTLYVEKMANSESCPSQAEQQRLIQQYETKFGMGQIIQQSFSRWGRNAARRQVFKIMLNSGWGKHCQRLNMPFSKVINDNDQQELLTLFANFNDNILKLNRITSVGNQVLISASKRSVTKYNLHGGYLPAGLFVPAYGRLELYKYLEILDKRVLYHDTDSIVYLYDPLLENIPSSNIWGEWDEEKISRPPCRGGIGPITKFLALGPKSYAIQTGSGKELIKLKGFSVKHAHKNLISYETLRMLLKREIPNIILPQMTFRYKYGQGIFTEFFKKELAFQPEILKGKLVGNLVYPHNYCEGCLDSNKEHVC